MFEKINQNIIEILGIDKLPEIDRVAAMEVTGSLVYEAIIARVIEVLEPEDRNAFEELISINQDPEVMFKYISEKIPNIEEISIQEAIKIRDSE